MGGAGVVSFHGTKIKGGKWTVSKFFLVSVAYTSVWLAVSSELGYYKELYGPQILLLLNLSYYAPSIPLLIFQSFLDEPLEHRLGVARTIGLRLVFSLISYATLCSLFPFLPNNNHSYLLVSVAILGALSSIAFSASYQLVARFANKNVIALGLGCTASGPIILALQITFGMKGTSPTLHQHVLLYSSISAIVMAGLWATISLLIRHWDAIEASNGDIDSLDTSNTASIPSPLPTHNHHHHTNTDNHNDNEESITEPLLEVVNTAATLTPRTSSEHIGTRPSTPLTRRPSIQAALAYNILEPYDQPFLRTRGEWLRKKFRRKSKQQQQFEGEDGHVDTNNNEFLDAAHASGDTFMHSIENGQHIMNVPTIGDTNPLSYNNNNNNDDAQDSDSDSFVSADEHVGDLSGFAAMVKTFAHIYPALVAIGIQSGIALTIFPFFTYMPSSGFFGEEFPKVLFFGRIFADLLGRMLPRVRALQPKSIWTVLIVAACKVAAEPLFFLYLKSPESMHSDVAAVIYVSIMWAASGYVNTASNMLAPHMVPPHLKSTAAGLMAITYQFGHFVGLSLAVLIAWFMYGSIGVH